MNSSSDSNPITGLDFNSLERQVLTDLGLFLEAYPETKRVLLDLSPRLVDEFLGAGRLKEVFDGVYDYQISSGPDEMGLRVLRMSARTPNNIQEARTLTIYGYPPAKQVSFIRELFSRKGWSKDYFLDI